jgi:hypothetical protein
MRLGGAGSWFDIAIAAFRALTEGASIVCLLPPPVNAVDDQW